MIFLMTWKTGIIEPEYDSNMSDDPNMPFSH